MISGGLILTNVILGTILHTLNIESFPIFVANLSVQVGSIIGGLFLLLGDRTGPPISLAVQLAQVVGLKTPTMNLTLWGILALPISLGLAPGNVREGVPVSHAVSINVLAVAIAVFLLWYWDHPLKRNTAEHAH